MGSRPTSQPLPLQDSEQPEPSAPGPSPVVPESPPSRARPRWLAALLSLLPVGCATAPRPPPVERHPPVLLVHGIDDTHRTLEPLRAYLVAAGWPEVEAMDLTPNDASSGLPALAEQVGAAAARLRARTGSDKIDVVAFSMGALATRYWLMRLDGKPAVRKFISLSGPHHGTWIAYFRGNTGAVQMRPGSPLLADLARDEGDWAPVEVISFWTPLDLMIVPARSSILTGATEQTFPVVAHPLMLRDGRVLEAVEQALRAPRYQPPGAWRSPDWP